MSLRNLRLGDPGGPWSDLGPPRPRRPLAFVQPCPMAVTPLVFIWVTSLDAFIVRSFTHISRHRQLQNLCSVPVVHNVCLNWLRTVYVDWIVVSADLNVGQPALLYVLVVDNIIECLRLFNCTVLVYSVYYLWCVVGAYMLHCDINLLT